MDNKQRNHSFLFTAPAWKGMAEFGSWWVEELGNLLPKGLKSAILPGVEVVLLEVQGAEVVVSHCNGEEHQRRARYALPPAALQSTQLKEIESLSRHSSEVVLCLPAEKVLVRPVTLPLAAEENLHEVLGFEMDRQTPFLLDQVYYDQLLTGRKPKENTLSLELIVTPKDYLDDLLDRLASLGLHPNKVTIYGDKSAQPMPVNLLPPALRARDPAAGRHLNLALGVLALLLLLGTVALPLIDKRETIKDLEHKVGLATARTEVSQQLREEIEQLTRSKQLLVTQKNATPLILAIISELTQLLPDDTWVNRLTIDGGEIHIEGQSASTAALIPLIESSDRLHNPRYRAPVTRVPRANAERFHLSAEVKLGLQP